MVVKTFGETTGEGLGNSHETPGPDSSLYSRTKDTGMSSTTITVSNQESFRGQNPRTIRL